VSAISLYPAYALSRFRSWVKGLPALPCSPRNAARGHAGGAALRHLRSFKAAQLADRVIFVNAAFPSRGSTGFSRAPSTMTPSRSRGRPRRRLLATLIVVIMVLPARGPTLAAAAVIAFFHAGTKMSSRRHWSAARAGTLRSDRPASSASCRPHPLVMAVSVIYTTPAILSTCSCNGSWSPA